MYTNIQPVVKPVWQPVSQNSCIVYTAGCQTGLYNRFDNRVEQQSVRSTRLSNRFVKHGLTTSCIVYTNIQPVVQQVRQPVVKQVRQPVGCLFTRYSMLSNRFDNRLYRVNGVLHIMTYYSWTNECHVSICPCITSHGSKLNSKMSAKLQVWTTNATRNSSGDETANKNTNFLRRHHTQIQWNNAK